MNLMFASMMRGASPSGVLETSQRLLGTHVLGAPAATSYNDSMDPMNRDELLATLRAHRETLAERFGVTSLALFGSYARGQAIETSDVDILVRFDGPATSKSYFGVQFYLEDLLGRPVDLVTDKALRPSFRPYVEREAVDV